MFAYHDAFCEPFLKQFQFTLSTFQVEWITFFNFISIILHHDRFFSSQCHGSCPAHHWLSPAVLPLQGGYCTWVELMGLSQKKKYLTFPVAVSGVLSLCPFHRGSIWPAGCHTYSSIHSCGLLPFSLPHWNTISVPPWHFLPPWHFQSHHWQNQNHCHLLFC